MAHRGCNSEAESSSDRFKVLVLRLELKVVNLRLGLQGSGLKWSIEKGLQSKAQLWSCAFKAFSSRLKLSSVSLRLWLQGLSTNTIDFKLVARFQSQEKEVTVNNTTWRKSSKFKKSSNLGVWKSQVTGNLSRSQRINLRRWLRGLSWKWSI